MRAATPSKFNTLRMDMDYGKTEHVTAQNHVVAVPRATPKARTKAHFEMNSFDWNQHTKGCGCELCSTFGKILVLQRRFLKMLDFVAEIASRSARPQSCQACGMMAVKSY